MFAATQLFQKLRKHPVRSPEIVRTAPGLVEFIPEVVDEYLQVFNVPLAKYTGCRLPSIQCVAWQVFIHNPRACGDGAADFPVKPPHGFLRIAARIPEAAARFVPGGGFVGSGQTKSARPDGAGRTYGDWRTAADYFFSASRISRSSFTSSEGSAGASGSAGFSSFLRESFMMSRTSMNTQKAMIKKSRHVCRKFP